MDIRKYIIIPEYRPLFAMKKCFGPDHGPLSEPCPVPIDIIGELLMQTGKESLSIYEVKYDSTRKKTIGEPIRLTKDNYKLSYDEIVSPSSTNIDPEKHAELVFEETTKSAETVVVEPEILTSDESDKVDEITDEEPEKVTLDDEIEKMKAVAAVIEQTVESETTAKSEEKPEADPYAGMTKAERRAARINEAKNKMNRQ